MKAFKGYGFFFIMLAILFMAYFFNDYVTDSSREGYNYSGFQADFEAGKVKQVTIQQNSEIPTGLVVVTFNEKDAKSKSFYTGGGARDWSRPGPPSLPAR